MQHRFILGMDPSGAFDEGKGTTGWNIYDCKRGRFLEVGAVFATGHKTAHDYWQAHLTLIQYKKVMYEDLKVSIEDFLIYKTQAQSLVNSHMETCQVLGIVKHFCFTKRIPYSIQPAVQVKKRWSNDILVHKGLIHTDRQHHYVDCCPGKMLSDHELDSMRHSLHCAYFKNKEE